MIKATKVLKKKFGDLRFGKLIWSHRKSAEMTQDQLADILGVTKQYISQLENGVRFASIKQAIKLAEVFEMSPDIFVMRVIKDQIKQASIELSFDSWFENTDFSKYINKSILISRKKVTEQMNNLILS